MAQSCLMSTYMEERTQLQRVNAKDLSLQLGTKESKDFKLLVSPQLKLLPSLMLRPSTWSETQNKKDGQLAQDLIITTTSSFFHHLGRTFLSKKFSQEPKSIEKLLRNLPKTRTNGTLNSSQLSANSWTSVLKKKS